MKPFRNGILLAVVFLAVQAVCDLYLPNIMSGIVNVGIQQSGIEDGVPEVISKRAFNLLNSFLPSQQKELLSLSYTLKSAQDTDKNGRAYSELYPNAQDIYVLGDVSGVVRENIEYAFVLANLCMQNALRALETDSDKFLYYNEDGIADYERLYPISSSLTDLPPRIMANAIREAQDNYSDSDLQLGPKFVKSCYSELGLDVVKKESMYIVRNGFIMILTALASGLASVAITFISSRVSAGIARDLRKDVFSRIINFSHSDFDGFSTASLITRSTNDIIQIQNLVMMGIRTFFYAPVMAVGGIIMALSMSAGMWWIIALACLLLFCLVGTVMSLVMPKFGLMQRAIDRLNLVSRETLSGLMVIRAFGNSDFEKGRFERANEDFAEKNLFVNRVMSFMMPSMMLIMNGVSVLIVWIGAENIAAASMKAGDMIAFMQYAMQIIMSFLFLSMMFVFLPRAAVSAERIGEILEVKPQINSPVSEASFPGGEITGSLQFRNVSFKYKGSQEYAVKNVSFSVSPGQTLGIIGVTGSGKSTLVNLIPRFYDVTDGEILFSGVNVRDINIKTLRSSIGYVPQKSILMGGTVASNVRYGNEEASDSLVEEVLDIAQCSGFVNESPEGVLREISQGGGNVSGGQRQRLSVARALAVKPKLYIFDDSFSALDFKTDAALRARLREVTLSSTVIIVAQRISTIMNADMILVIDNGEVVGIGTHNQLLETCQEYADIASVQNSNMKIM